MKKRILALSLALLLLALPLFTACDNDDETPPAATFTPPPFDEGAQTGTPEVDSALGWSEVDANGVYKVSVCGVVKVENKKADVYLTNPEGNNVWLKLRILDAEGNILGQTGLIKPGEYVRTITFDTVPDAGSKIVMKVMGYVPDTYQSAGAVSLNTVIS